MVLFGIILGLGLGVIRTFKYLSVVLRTGGSYLIINKYYLLTLEYELDKNL